MSKVGNKVGRVVVKKVKNCDQSKALLEPTLGLTLTLTVLTSTFLSNMNQMMFNAKQHTLGFIGSVLKVHAL